MDRLGRAGRLVTSDAAPQMVEAARRRAAELGLGGVEFRVLDAADLDLPDASVDAVLLRFGLMLVPEPAAALAELRRVLRPGGRAALAVWAAASENEWMTATGRAALELGLMPRPDPDAPGPFRLADREALVRLVEGAGLRVAAAEEVPLEWRAASLEEWWEIVRDMSQLLSGLLASSPPETGAALRARAFELLAPHVQPDGSLRVPGLARALLAVRD